VRLRDVEVEVVVRLSAAGIEVGCKIEVVGQMNVVR
jgi:hypothetical protein